MMYSLNSLAEKTEVGNKAFVLMDLHRSNYNVPDGFVISSDTIKTKNDIKKHETELKTHFKNEIIGFPVVVRSSSPHEDSANLTYAGQFKSVININSFSEMYDAILEVGKSGRIDLTHYDAKHKAISPAIIVQKQINPRYSGVLFTQHPVTKKGFLLEYVSGHLSKMVSGKEHSHKIHSKVNLSEKFLEVYNAGKQIEQYYGMPQDIEFIIDLENKFWIVQSRPITALKNKNTIKHTKLPKTFEKIKGVSLSSGYFKGSVQFIYDDLDPKEADKVFKNGNILATYVLFPEFNRVYHKSKGIICMVDSITSHPAIIARELGIPCVGGINITRLSKQLKDLDTVVLDADKGEIYIKPRVKILEKIQRGLTHMKFPATKEYLALEKDIILAIKGLDEIELQKSIDSAIKSMRKNMGAYLKTNKKSNLNQAKSIFYNISNLLQHKFILMLKDTGYSHKSLLNSFADVDSGKIDSKLGRVYFIIKNSIQSLDKKAICRGKSLWEL